MDEFLLERLFLFLLLSLHAAEGETHDQQGCDSPHKLICFYDGWPVVHGTWLSDGQSRYREHQ